MPTKLSKALKREVEIKGVLYTVTVAPEGLKIVEKGKRKGQELSWEALVSGSAALTKDLEESISLAGKGDSGTESGDSWNA
jgi:hypothetical protein